MNNSLILAQKILDMLDETGVSGMEQWDALNIATRLVDIHKPPKEDSTSFQQADSDSWPTELGSP